MSGRYEQEQELERKIQNRLHEAPPILTDYYYHMIGSGKSYTTTYRYINYILSFMQFTFKDKYDERFYLKVKSLHINKYITSLRTKNVNGQVVRTSDSIRSTQWSALNSFFQFLVPEYVSANPVDNTQRPKNKDNPHVTYLTSEEISKLLAYVEANAQDMFKHRDLCILKLGFSTGLRVSAIVNIDVDDVDFKNNRIRVTEKGDYDDYILFGENLKAQLTEWLKEREKYFGGIDTNALFISRNHQRITDRSVACMIEKYAKNITDKKVSPHVMRHSCATGLYEQTKDIYLCSKQLRHKNVTTTQRYAELSQERQKAATNILDQLIT